jgi:four helix bundle protein
MKRGCSSIAANIAEGGGRSSDADMARFLQMALGSASELEYHLLLSRDLGFLDKPLYDDLNERTTEVQRMLTSFIRRLKAES